MNNQDIPLDPYHMNRYHVRMHHFQDARIYDRQIKQAGWTIQRNIIRKKYNQWLRSIRSLRGWEDFRRVHREVVERIQGDDGNVYFVRHVVQSPPVNREKSLLPKNNKRNKDLPPSTENGINISDENYRPKMFTMKMGQEISRIRTNLGLTQAELAKKINVDANMIRNIEVGGLITFNPKDNMVKSLARALNIPSIVYQE